MIPQQRRIRRAATEATTTPPACAHPGGYDASNNAGVRNLTTPPALDWANQDTRASAQTGDQIESEPSRGEQVVPVYRVRLLPHFGEPDLGQHTA